MAGWLVSREELTNDQARAVVLSPDENRLILGAPGSGKTLVLIHRAKHLAEHFRCGPDRFRVFVFTKALRDYIRSGTNELGIPDGSITTFSSWCVEYYRAHVSNSLPRDSERQIDFAAITTGVDRYLRSLRQNSIVYDFIVVDEGQDFDDETYSIMTRIARHVTVCSDHKQQIYEQGSDEAAMLKQLSIRKQNLTLLEAYRCSPYVSRLAAQNLRNLVERETFLKQIRTQQMDRETPVLYVAKDWQDERKQLFAMVSLRQSRGESIAIVVPQKKHVFGFAKGLAEEKIIAQTQDKLDFDSDALKLVTFHGAKGLTFDTVLMPRLVSNSFLKVKPDQLARLLFVGTTRATKWVYMSTVEGEEIDALAPLLAGDAGDALTIVRSGDAPIPDPSPKPKKSSKVRADDELLDLF